MSVPPIGRPAVAPVSAPKQVGPDPSDPSVEQTAPPDQLISTTNPPILFLSAEPTAKPLYPLKEREKVVLEVKKSTGEMVPFDTYPESNKARRVIQWGGVIARGL